MIIAGSTSQALAAELAATLDEPLAAVETKQFPDGERYVRVPTELDEAIVVASTVSDGALVELLQLQDAAAEAGATDMTTVVPYLGYARQDKAFNPGEAISARALAQAISTGTDRVLTVNPHEGKICDFFDVPAEGVDAAGQLADPLPELTDPVFVAPDEGAIDLAETVSDAYGHGETDYFEKTRHSGDEVSIEPSDASVVDRPVVLVDDIIATGSTMSEAVGILNDRGAGAIYVTCVHPLLARTALLDLRRAGVEAVYGTDTIERSVSTVSAAPVLATTL